MISRHWKTWKGKSKRPHRHIPTLQIVAEYWFSRWVTLGNEENFHTDIGFNDQSCQRTRMMRTTIAKWLSWGCGAIFSLFSLVALVVVQVDKTLTSRQLAWWRERAGSWLANYCCPCRHRPISWPKYCRSSANYRCPLCPHSLAWPFNVLYPDIGWSEYFSLAQIMQTHLLLLSSNIAKSSKVPSRYNQRCRIKL